MLARALKIQAGLIKPDSQPTDLKAFHVNQRNEGIDLNGVSGALMATTNMQMQTFVTQPNGAAEGFDGYNGVMAFAANQRDEVRDLHDVAGALGQRRRHWIQRIGCSNPQGQPRRELYAVCFMP